jgi:hypothetical protein
LPAAEDLDINDPCKKPTALVNLGMEMQATAYEECMCLARWISTNTTPVSSYQHHQWGAGLQKGVMCQLVKGPSQMKLQQVKTKARAI